MGRCKNCGAFLDSSYDVDLCPNCLNKNFNQSVKKIERNFNQSVKKINKERVKEQEE